MNGTPQEGAPLSEKDAAIIRDLLAELQSADQVFYGLVADEDIQVTKGNLNGGSGTAGSIIRLGRHFITPDTKTWKGNKYDWLVLEEAGGNLEKGIEPGEEERTKAAKTIYERHTPEEIADMKAEIDVRSHVYYHGVLILDLDAITTIGGKPGATLKHELAHFIYDVSLQRKTPNLAKTSPPLKDNRDFKTEFDLLSEIAAEGAEATYGSDKAFDFAAFLDEYDPRFGVSGYRDLQGQLLAPPPKGYAIRIGQSLSLLKARQVAELLQNKGFPNLFLKTVVSQAAETRTFRLYIGPYTKSKEAKAVMVDLKKAIPNFTMKKAKF